MIEAPRFWSDPTSLRARLLSPLGALYGAATAWRMGRPARARADVPVICVGNLTVGGAGKTPTVLALADWFIEQGFKPGLLSRGYGGRITGPVRVDPTTHTAEDVGDEPLLLAIKAPTVITRDRVAGAKLFAGSIDLIIMDDGFQNPSLHKDLSLVVIDGEAGVGNGFCLPAGPLRAPITAQMRHADAIVAIGGPPSAPTGNLPVLAAHIRPDADWVALKNKRVLAYAGIGRPEKFFQMLASQGAKVEQAVRLGDHALPSPETVKTLLNDANASDLQLVTTEKDAARMAGVPGYAELLKASYVAKVTLAFEDTKALRQVLKTITNRSQAPSAA